MLIKCHVIPIDLFLRCRHYAFIIFHISSEPRGAMSQHLLSETFPWFSLRSNHLTASSSFVVTVPWSVCLLEYLSHFVVIGCRLSPPLYPNPMNDLIPRASRVFITGVCCLLKFQGFCLFHSHSQPLRWCLFLSCQWPAHVFFDLAIWWHWGSTSSHQHPDLCLRAFPCHW